MPTFAYAARSRDGKTKRGTMSAESRQALIQMLQSRGLTADPKSIRERGKGRVTNLSMKRVRAGELLLFTRQMATMVNAGLPLLQSLDILAEQTEDPVFCKIIQGIALDVEGGETFSEALRKYPRAFPDLYVSMVRAGEAGGALAIVLERIADYLENQVRLTNKVSSILAYPAFMLVFAGLVVTALVTVVLPQITGLLLSLDQDLPIYTVWIIGISNFARSWWWAVLIAIAIGVILLRSAIATDRGRAIFDQFNLRLPVIGRIVRTVSIARFSRTLSTLLSSGVGIVQALEISQHVAQNVVIRDAIRSARTSVLEGASLAAPLKASGQFPPMVITMIEVGERGSEVGAMLNRVAENYDEQVENSITKLTSLLEPLMLLVMVGVVLVIILATLMPLLEITNSMN